MRLKILLIAAGLLLGACAPGVTDPDWVSLDAVPTVDPANVSLAEGQRQYNIYCAHCHGYLGEGQNPSSRIQTEALGYQTVPPHDETGSTWRHPDQLLHDAIKYGIESPLNLYPMSEYGSRLSDDQIQWVIDYMKGWWTDEQRANQARLTEEWAARQPASSD